jgi:hypothetical protein
LVVTAEQDAVTTQPSTVVETIEIDLTGKYRVRVSSGVDAEDRCCYRRLINTPDRISESPPRGGLSVCGASNIKLLVNVYHGTKATEKFFVQMDR